VAANGNYSVAVKKDGSLWHWGLFNSPLGYRVESSKGTWLSPARIGIGTNWSSVFCGDHFTMATQRDGRLWACGQVPVAGARSYITVREPMHVGGDTQWKALAPGFGNTAGIQADGTLWMWQDSYTRPTWRLGASRSRRVDGLAKISERSDWIAVAVSSDTVLGLSADGRLWSWGRPLNEPWTTRRFLCYSRRPELIADLARAVAK
jgi:alpha-tubulin suppressor-like RCC1 family protein